MQWIRKSLPVIAALAIVATLYSFTRLPDLGPEGAKELAASFSFQELELPIVDGPLARKVRQVHPSLERVSAWISATGAAVALGDLDRDGLANDYCLVDPRENGVFVGPVPSSDQRYETFTLSPAPLSFSDQTMAPMGCLPGDFNEDGLPDLLVYYWGRTPIMFLAQSSEGDREGTRTQLSRSRYIAREVVPEVPNWNSNGGTIADFDGDGHLDIVITNYFADGDAALDAEGSGTVAMQTSMSTAENGGSTRLLLWKSSTSGQDPSATFRDVSSQAFEDSVSRRWTLAVGAVDLDGDLLPELFMANDFGADVLLHNRSTPGQVEFAPLEGRRLMRSPRSKVLGHDSFKGMGVDFGDLNHDGILDIYVSNIAQEFALEESHHVFLSTGDLGQMVAGIAPYRDESEALGLARSAFSWDARLADFNNDGELEAMQATGFVRGEVDRWPELHELAIGNDGNVSTAERWPRFQLGDDLSGRVHNPFFVRDAGGRYHDVARELGLATPYVSRGIAIADIDGDGDLDFALANQWDDSKFFLNTAANAGKFLGLRLFVTGDQEVRGAHVVTESVPVGSWPAVGAAATLHRSKGRVQVGYVDGGNGHSGVRSPEIHFGLGDFESQPLVVDLRWRSRDGDAVQQTLSVSPGWNTVVLGQAKTETRGKI